MRRINRAKFQERIFKSKFPRRKPHEEWRPVIGFDGYYVSNYGRVFNANLIRNERKAMKPYENSKGRITITLTKNGKRYKKIIARLVAEAFIPNPENKPEVHHIDGNPRNNNVKNLRWVTKEEHNALHKCMRRAKKNKRK